MAPERTPAKKGVGGALARKLGPFPVWVWALIVTALILGYVWFKASRSQQQSTPADTAGQGQVPQFVNQTFVQPGPPGPPDEDTGGDDDDDKGGHLPHGEPPPIKVPPMHRHHPKPPQPRNPPPTVGGHGGQGGGGKGPPPRRKRHHKVRPPHIVHGRGRP